MASTDWTKPDAVMRRALELQQRRAPAPDPAMGPKFVTLGFNDTTQRRIHYKLSDVPEFERYPFLLTAYLNASRSPHEKISDTIITLQEPNDSLEKLVSKHVGEVVRRALGYFEGCSMIGIQFFFREQHTYEPQYKRPRLFSSFRVTLQDTPESRARYLEDARRARDPMNDDHPSGVL